MGRQSVSASILISFVERGIIVCPTCGNQTHKKSGDEWMPITITNGSVQKGRCLDCCPDASSGYRCAAQEEKTSINEQQQDTTIGEANAKGNQMEHEQKPAPAKTSARSRSPSDASTITCTEVTPNKRTRSDDNKVEELKQPKRTKRKSVAPKRIDTFVKPANKTTKTVVMKKDPQAYAQLKDDSEQQERSQQAALTPEKCGKRRKSRSFKWTCETCTYENNKASIACDMCGKFVHNQVLVSDSDISKEDGSTPRASGGKRPRTRAPVTAPGTAASDSGNNVLHPSKSKCESTRPLAPTGIAASDSGNTVLHPSKSKCEPNHMLLVKKQSTSVRSSESSTKPTLAPTGTAASDSGNTVPPSKCEPNHRLLVKKTSTSNTTNVRRSSSVAEREWRDRVTKQAIKFCRLRIFVNDSKTTDDPAGRRPSEWCLQHGYVASCARVIPDSISTSNDAKKFLRQPLEDMKIMVEQSAYFDDNLKKTGGLTRYCNSYRLFGKMALGDIVAMQVPGLQRGQGMTYFGVIQSNEILIRTKDEVLQEDFPCPEIFELTVFECERLMLRRVKWMRNGLTRDLPSQNIGKNGLSLVSWLLESSPFWIVDVSKKEGLQLFQTDSFLHATDVVENQNAAGL